LEPQSSNMYVTLLMQKKKQIPAHMCCAMAALLLSTNSIQTSAYR